MKVSKEELIRINHGFGGNLRSGSSLDFAFIRLGDKKLGTYKKLAYLVRAILVDHPFSDANKRTAMFVAFDFAKQYNRVVDRELLLHQLISISKQNIISIKNIEWRIKSAIRGN